MIGHLRIKILGIDRAKLAHIIFAVGRGRQILQMNNLQPGKLRKESVEYPVINANRN